MIAHRGLSSQIPENTLEAFEAAHYTGADFIELDIQISKDRVLVVSHDPFLSRLTNIETKTEFIKRKRTQVYAGKYYYDWWIIDFTIEELKTLGV